MPIAFTEADIAKDITRSRLKDGKFPLRVTAAALSVNDKGNLKVTAKCHAVNSNGDTVGPPTSLFLTLPVKTPATDLAKAGLPDDVQKKIPNTIFFITNYYKARKNPKNAEKYPVEPTQKLDKINGKWTVVNGKGVPTGEELQTKDESAAHKEVLAKQVRQFISDLYDDASIIVGDEFYGDNSYGEEFEMTRVEVSEDQSSDGVADMTTLEA